MLLACCNTNVTDGSQTPFLLTDIEKKLALVEVLSVLGRGKKNAPGILVCTIFRADIISSSCVYYYINNILCC